ncbi:MAG TPA: hypothetical protein VMT88_01335 [Actinomycetes bacterium]|nr:hypothetical protein [Actinomycetes bacterium]
MWVRIDEITFAPDFADEVIDHVRNTAMTSHGGEGFRGFRLLVDRASGHALDVSYWDSQVGAVAAQVAPTDDPTATVATAKTRSNVYELCIDAV